MPAHEGMYSSGILIKNPAYNDDGFMSFWWKQVSKYSRRDQLSLAYTIYKTKLNIGLIKDDIFDNSYSYYHLHAYNHYIEQNKIMNYNYGWLKKSSFLTVKLMRKLKKINK